MIKAGVIGHPISHSKSPLIHGYWLKKYGIDGEYLAYDIAPDQLRDGIRKLIDAGLSGFNVTIPHKQKVLDLCDVITPAAEKIGAVNTITIDGNGRLHGDNTDAFGFAENLRSTYPDIDWTGKTALVIGAGGASRAIVYALKNIGVTDICITNRTDRNALDLAGFYNVHHCVWDKKQDKVPRADIIINTTSLGMVGQPSLDISLSGISKAAIVYDIVYNPLMTPLLQQANRNGAKTVTGIGMLLHQARPGFKAWFGIYPEVTKELENHIKLQGL